MIIAFYGHCHRVFGYVFTFLQAKRKVASVKEEIWCPLFEVPGEFLDYLNAGKLIGAFPAETEENMWKRTLKVLIFYC